MILYIVLLILLSWCFVRKRRGTNDKPLEGAKTLEKPPGPREYPFVGGLLYFLFKKRKHNFLQYRELSKVYGPICGLKAGIMDFDDIEISKNICNSQDFTNRYPIDQRVACFYERSFHAPNGLIFGAGKNWRDNRFFAIKNLKQFGFGKSAGMDKGLQDELEHFAEHLNNTLRPVQSTQSFVLTIRHLFCVATTNILWNMVAGFRFSYDDEKLRKLLQYVQVTSKKCNPQVNLYYAFPFMRHIPGLTNFHHWKELNLNLMEFSRDMITARKKDVIPNDPQNFLDIYLEEIEAKKGTSDESSFNEDILALNCVDLFFGGSETSSNALEFGILYMVLNPEVQRKVQQEIDTVIGSNRIPTLLDKEKMPYTEATIYEILRWANVLPLNCRSPVKDVEIQGYHVPEGAYVVTNQYSIHFSETLWEDPYSFRPERFLDKDMNIINLHKIIPFGFGKRVCLGESLAKAAIFMFFTYLLQNYTFERTSKDQKLTTDPIAGFSCSPQAFDALLTPRHRHKA